jgi:hypothetical protein
MQDYGPAPHDEWPRRPIEPADRLRKAPSHLQQWPRATEVASQIRVTLYASSPATFERIATERGAVLGSAVYLNERWRNRIFATVT